MTVFLTEMTKILLARQAHYFQLHKQPDTVVSIIIHGYLSGKTRDEIALENGVSSGKVSETIKQWKKGIGIPEIEDLRKFAVSIKKTNVSVGDCAKGFRIIQILKNMGIEESDDGNFDEFLSFIEEIYLNCKGLGINPSIVPYWIKDAINFFPMRSNNYTNINEPDSENKTPVQISSQTPLLSLITEFISQSKIEISKLEQNRQKVKNDIKRLAEQKQNELSQIEYLRQEENNILYYKDWFYELKDELWRNHSIRIEEIGKFARVIRDFKNQHYNPYGIIKEYASLMSANAEVERLKHEIWSLQKEKTLLLNSVEHEEAQLSFHKQTMYTYSELEAMKFGIKELKQLWSTIHELSKTNNIEPEKAVSKFFKDIEDQYDDKLGFEYKVNEKSKELANITNELEQKQFLLQVQPYVDPILTQLLTNGLNAEDIININQIVWRFGKEHSVSSTNANDKNTQEIKNKRSEYWKTFNQRLQTMLDIDSELNNQQKKLEVLNIEIANLNVQKQELLEQGQGATNYLIFMFDRIQYYSKMLRNIHDELDDKRKAFSRLGPLLIILVYISLSKKDNSKSRQKDEQ